MELILDGVSRSFGGQPILRQFSLGLHGGVTGILGPNGAGKTTLMRILAGLLAPDEGTLQVNGLQGEAALAVIRREMGYLPQSLELPRHLTPRVVLRYIAGLRRMRVYGRCHHEIAH